MPKILNTILRLTLPAMTALLLSACGGGGGGGGVAMTPTPAPDPTPDPTPSPTPIDARPITLPDEYNNAPFNLTTDIDTSGLNSPDYQREAAYGIKNSNVAKLHWTQGSADMDQLGPNRYVRGYGVTVAVVDSSFDLTHEDLISNFINPDGHDPSLVNNEKHGTHVAGIIGAQLNGTGVVGVAPEAKIVPIRYLNGGAGLPTAYDLVVANNAFVANNSWGPRSQWARVSVGAGMVNYYDDSALATGHYWLNIPHWFSYSQSGGMLNSVSKRTGQGIYSSMSNRAVNDDVLLVFAQGNTGWNSATGAPRICPDGDASYTDELECSVTLRLDLTQTSFSALTISGIDNSYNALYTSTAAVATVAFLEDNSDMLSRLPVEEVTAAISNWINVVAIDGDDEITFFSDGCGVTKMICLAAAGLSVTSTVPGNDYEDLSGTSMAAPHVTGAAALLKGAFPNLTGSQVATILLESADGAGACAGETTKLTTCVDDAYGHGILNVEAAFTPTSFLSIGIMDDESNIDGFSGFALADSRIALSPVFASAPWRDETIDVGSVDNYGRVYFTRIDFAEGVWVATPTIVSNAIDGAGVHAAYAAPTALQVVAAGGGGKYLAADAQALQTWGNATAGIETGVGYSTRALQLFSDGETSLSWRWRSGVADRQTAPSGWWQAAFDSGETQVLEISRRLSSADGIGIGVGIAMSAGENLRQTAARWRWRTASSSVQLEGGIVQEQDSVLGATFSGGFSLDGADTTYHRIAASHRIADKGELFADWVAGKTSAASAGGLVQSLSAQIDSWSAGAAYGNWRLQASQPLAIDTGAMALSYLSGYTAGGDYAISNRVLDLTPDKRLQRLSLLYTNKASTGLSIAAGIEYLQNAPTQNYNGNIYALSAALRYTF